MHPTRPSPRTFSIIAILAALLLTSAAHAHPPGAEVPKADKKPLIQMAILLDTSGSMDGLIDQARSQLWSVVNDFATARRGGVRPELQVALYEYGNDGLPASEGYIRMIVPLTTDLDKISEELFALRTNGGSEYCGQSIQKATRELQWSADNRDLKVIFIAGNEPFSQGPVDYRGAVKEAIAKGISVNTIHCGDERTGVATGWKDGAVLADGSFLNIDHNQKVVHIPAPQDAEIARLGVELNKTYVAYGREGRVAAERQAKQDANAESAGMGSATQRAQAKSSAHYDNSRWDLVDAKKKGKVAVKDMKPEELPEEMRKMTPAEREAHIAKLEKQRAAIQEKIRKLSAERDKYVAAKRAEQTTAGKGSLDEAIKKSVRKAASQKAFTF